MSPGMIASPVDVPTQQALQRLRDPATIRSRAQTLCAWVADGHSSHFSVHRERMPAIANRVATLTRQRFPDLKTPYHSRWRHFEAGSFDRKAVLNAATIELSPSARACAQIDLVMVSVLLDAGAGPQWHYHEAETGIRLSRSEGLGVASFAAFMHGLFSSDENAPYQVDAQGLKNLQLAQLASAFQVSDQNPLVGLEGRLKLLHALGDALLARPEEFGPQGRPGGLYATLTTRHGSHIRAEHVLGLLLDAFSTIWPSGQWLTPTAAVGDAWRHRALIGSAPGALDDGWIPFHKLSQWLSYSLLEPFAWAGTPIAGLEALTGLPEYRNGGLLLDGGVLVPRDPEFASRTYTPSDEWCIEWRGLTVALLDELALAVCQQLGAELPLACILEGGTWAAGRQIARELRVGGGPPVHILSDGTVF